MRKILLLLFIIPFFVTAQTYHLPQNTNGEYEFVGKVSIHENKKEVFRRLQEWLAVRKFGEPISINTKNNKTFTGKLAANNYDYIDTTEYRIRGSGYVQYSPFRPYMYVTFDYQLTAQDGAYIYDFKRFNVISFLKGKSMKAHSLRVSIYSGGGGNMSDAKSETKSLETIISESKAKKSKIIRAQNMQDVENFKVNMQAMLGGLNRTVNGVF